MKKLLFGMVVMFGVLMFGTAEAQEAEKREVARTGFVDTNGDGVCDNYDGSQRGKGLGSQQGEAVRKGEGRRSGEGCRVARCRVNRQGERRMAGVRGACLNAGGDSTAVRRGNRERRQ